MVAAERKRAIHANAETEATKRGVWRAMATLNDVARLAGVDASTASRVLREDPQQAVRPETRLRILAAADELDYRPNPIARALRTQKTDTIGLITPRFSDFAFTQVMHGIQAAALDAHQSLMVVGWDVMGDDVLAKREVLNRFIHGGVVDGLLVAFATIEDLFTGELSESPIPIVLVNRRTPAVRGSVTADDAQAARVAVEHLVNLGHARIGYIGLQPGTSTAAGRQMGFQSAILDAGLEIAEHWTAVAGAGLAGGRTALAEILNRSAGDLPTALVVASIRPAVSVVSELPVRGLKVPSDISVISIGDNEFADITSPRLTTVWLPFEAMGRRSVEMLLDIVGGGEPLDIRLEDPPRLVLRSSTSSPKTT
jgi:LacI family transcriptional regulator